MSPNTDAAIKEVKAAAELVDQLQHQFHVGSPTWHALETIGDRLHDALTALGD